jgi:hypothetical protein
MGQVELARALSGAARAPWTRPPGSAESGSYQETGSRLSRRRLGTAMTAQSVPASNDCGHPVDAGKADLRLPAGRVHHLRLSADKRLPARPEPFMCGTSTFMAPPSSAVRDHRSALHHLLTKTGTARATGQVALCDCSRRYGALCRGRARPPAKGGGIAAAAG